MGAADSQLAWLMEGLLTAQVTSALVTWDGGGGDGLGPGACRAVNFEGLIIGFGMPYARKPQGAYSGNKLRTQAVARATRAMHSRARIFFGKRFMDQR